MATITQKRGDTLEWVVTLSESGAPVDLTSWTILSQIRNGATLIDQLTVTVVDAENGQFRLSATPAETEAYSAGTFACDIQFTDDSSDVFSTETFQVSVIEDVSDV